MSTPKIVATNKVRDGYYVLHVSTEDGPLDFGAVTPEMMTTAIAEVEASGEVALAPAPIDQLAEPSPE